MVEELDYKLPIEDLMTHLYWSRRNHEKETSLKAALESPPDENPFEEAEMKEKAEMK